MSNPEFFTTSTPPLTNGSTLSPIGARANAGTSRFAPLTADSLFARGFAAKGDGRYSREFSNGWEMFVVFGEQSPSAFVEFWHSGHCHAVVHDVKTTGELTDLFIQHYQTVTPL